MRRGVARQQRVQVRQGNVSGVAGLVGYFADEQSCW